LKNEVNISEHYEQNHQARKNRLQD